jgi:DNA (cytosine-5)-methyltransferase 1
MSTQPIRYLSLFSGIGGFELGIQRAFSNQQTTEIEQDRQGRDRSLSEAGNDVHNRSDAPLCVGYSEIDKYAIKVYERQFNGHTNYGDATKINPAELPDFDLLVGGFPCQAFSIAGKRNGFNDTRGTLFFDIARILAEKRPRHLVLENVKGLLSHDSGKTFQTILGVLSDLGYRVEWQVLNSKDFGVPQNRERVFIVGHLGNECGRKVFPITGQSNKYTTLGKSAETAVARTLTGGGHSGGNHSGLTILQLNNPTHSNNRVYGTDGVSPTLNTMQGGARQPFIAPVTRFSEVTNATKAKVSKLTNYMPNLIEAYYAAPVLTPDRLEKRQNGRRMKDNGEPAFTVTAQDRHGLYDGARIRRLTPLECERLQGFPDNWTEGESDTQRYKMCGNAVTVNVVEAVMERLFNETV